MTVFMKLDLGHSVDVALGGFGVTPSSGALAL